MACRGFWECLLKLFNFLLAISGLSMVAYGIYLLVLFTKASSGDGGGGGDLPVPPNPYEPHLLKLGRPMFLLVSLSENIIDKLPKAWYDFFI